MNWSSLLGMFILLFFAWLISENKRNQNFRLIIGVIILEFLIGYFLFRLNWGISLFESINHIVIKLADIANEGSRFLFGPLSISPGQKGSLGFILFFQALPTIVFFSALISILYYYKIMNILIETFAFIFNKLFRISGAESLVAASNIFVGIESILTVRPLISQMTRSELHTILTAGLATVASNVMAVYIFTLQNVFPQIAGHLVTASILSAPAAIMFSKIIVPETNQPLTLGIHVKVEYQKENSLIEAIINGSNSGLKLIFGIVALLLSVIGLVALLDQILIAITSYFGNEVSLKVLLGYLFYPFVWGLGIPEKDIFNVATIIGERMILTEVYSYQRLAELLQNQQIDLKSAVIASYVLCGFTHFASLAIFTGGIQALVPERTRTLASISLKALIAATLADLYTGAIAGFFYSGTSYLIK
ncbi:MAG: nucleoside permease [Leptospiraceae bacterium]|nr:MAG: nucleoside permease [Leptospiraceae bacterium]